jgi:hypothetical protein
MSDLNSFQQIDLHKPNPFTVRPIPTEATSNELLLTDHKMRTQSRVAIADVGLTQASTFISPMHLNMGWKWK